MANSRPRPAVFFDHCQAPRWLLLLLLGCAAWDSYTPLWGGEPDRERDSFDSYDFDDNPRNRDIRHPAWFKLSFLDLRQDLRDATAAGKQGLMVYFGQENCAYCEALMEKDFGEADIVHYTRQHFDVVALDIWGAREVTDLQGSHFSEREFAVHHQTNFTPSILFFDAGGRLALRLRGYHPPYRFRAALEYVADRHYQRESFRSYLERADPPPKFEPDDLNEQEFLLPPPHVLDRSRIRANRPLLVLFEQAECHACDVMHTEPFSDYEIIRKLRRFDVVQLDRWSEQPLLTPSGTRTTARAWAESLDITFAPSLVFFDEGGREVMRLDSVAKFYRLNRLLDYILERGYAGGLNYQQWHGRRRTGPASSDDVTR